MILLQIFTHIRCVRNKSVLREERVDLFAGRHGRGRADALHGQGSQAACEAGSLPDVLALGQSGQQAAIEGIVLQIFPCAYSKTSRAWRTIRSTA